MTITVRDFNLLAAGFCTLAFISAVVSHSWGWAMANAVFVLANLACAEVARRTR